MIKGWAQNWAQWNSKSDDHPWSGSAVFVTFNCVGLHSDLIERELFGYEKGAFTGVLTRKIGCFEQANGGTLFLDEIGDLSLASQSKLLRVLDEHKFERVGGTESLPVRQ